jgi:diaminopimelate decarboxylase
MDHFQLRNGELCAEDVPLAQIADEVGTPVYVYSRATLERHARVFREALAPLGRVHLAFAVKANPNLAVLKVMQREGLRRRRRLGRRARRALAAGMPAADIVFSGVGKQHWELIRALDAGIGQFNLESEEEGEELAELAAARGIPAPARCGSIPTSTPAPTTRSRPAKADNKFGVPIGEGRRSTRASPRCRVCRCAGSRSTSAASCRSSRRSNAPS